MLRHARVARTLMRCLVLLLAILPEAVSRDGPSGFAASAHDDPPQGMAHHMKIGIALLANNGYQEWLDAESIVAALVNPPTLRASVNTTWSFEIFCAHNGAAEYSRTEIPLHSTATDGILRSAAKATLCPRHGASAGVHESYFNEALAASETAGMTFGAWTMRLDRLITLTVHPAPSICADMAARRVVNAGEEKRATGRKEHHHYGKATGSVEGKAGAVCFHLPNPASLESASSWQLWQTHSLYHTEVSGALKFSALLVLTLVV